MANARHFGVDKRLNYSSCRETLNSLSTSHHLLVKGRLLNPKPLNIYMDDPFDQADKILAYYTLKLSRGEELSPQERKGLITLLQEMSKIIERQRKVMQSLEELKGELMENRRLIKRQEKIMSILEKRIKALEERIFYGRYN